MQDSWQVLMKPAMSAPHVDATLQAGASNAAAMMAGRVLFPFSRWNDLGKAEDHVAAHCERSENHWVTTTMSRGCDTENLTAAIPQSWSVGAMAGGLAARTAEASTGTPGSCGNMEAAEHKATVGYIAVTPTSASASGNVGNTEVANHIAAAGGNTAATRQRYSTMALQDDGFVGMVKVAGHDTAMSNSFDSTVTAAGGGHGCPINMASKSMPRNAKLCKQQQVVQYHPTGHAVPRCQIEGCKQDLSKAKKDYHRRHKVCEMHSKAASVLKSGLQQRFCQQCSRFHVVSDFDDAKRSCRRRLEGHNRRRRKPISQGYGKLIDLNEVVQQHQQLMAAAALMTPLQQQYLLNQSNITSSNGAAASQTQLLQLHQPQLQLYDQNLQQAAMVMSNSTALPANLDEINNRILSLLSYHTKGTPSSSSPSSSSSSSPSLFNHSNDPPCALSLLSSCQPPPDQAHTRHITQENFFNPNLSHDNNPMTNISNHLSSNPNMINLNAYINNSDDAIQPTINIKSTSGEPLKDMPYTYPLYDYWQHLGLLQHLGQHHNPNAIAGFLKQQEPAKYSNHNPHI
eukprot:c19683_g1_i1 orf=252-1961(+)